MYQHLLLAIDLSPDSTYLLQRACTLARNWHAALTIITVIEPFPYDPTDNFIGPTELEFENQRRVDAQQRLDALAQSTDDDLSVATQLLTGSINREIVAASKELQTDLILVGSHERHGLALFLNSTADAVLHKSPCDVLAIRVPDIISET